MANEFRFAFPVGFHFGMLKLRSRFFSIKFPKALRSREKRKQTTVGRLRNDSGMQCEIKQSESDLNLFFVRLFSFGLSSLRDYFSVCARVLPSKIDFAHLRYRRVDNEKSSYSLHFAWEKTWGGRLIEFNRGKMRNKNCWRLTLAAGYWISWKWGEDGAEREIYVALNGISSLEKSKHWKRAEVAHYWITFLLSVHGPRCFQVVGFAWHSESSQRLTTKQIYLQFPSQFFISLFDHFSNSTSRLATTIRHPPPTLP